LKKFVIISVILIVLVLLSVAIFIYYMSYDKTQFSSTKPISEDLQVPNNTNTNTTNNIGNKKSGVTVNNVVVYDDVIVIGLDKPLDTSISNTQNVVPETPNPDTNNTTNSSSNSGGNTNSTNSTETTDQVTQEIYYISVNVATNTVTVYTKDENHEFTVPFKSFVCSTGEATPTSGIYKISNRFRWLDLFGNVYGQYATQIVGNILFHSVPYAKKYDNGSLLYEEYDKLGTSASAGCIRLTVEDAKWIYDNCKNNTIVEFLYDPNQSRTSW
jgi:lipoprotein-anchoring transpeptidase ErfK/SrfK